KNPFLTRKLASEMQRVRAGDRHDLIDVTCRYRLLGQLRNEIRRPALHEMRTKLRMAAQRRAVDGAWLSDAAAKHRRVVGLGSDDLGCRARLPQHTGDAVDRSASAKSRNPVVEP